VHFNNISTPRIKDLGSFFCIIPYKKPKCPFKTIFR